MLEKNTGRRRGFGFITFSDRRGMDDAIREMHGQELGERIISVNKAEPKMGEDIDHGYRGAGYSTGGRGGSYGGGGGDKSARQDECFKCGRLGHWARDCHSVGGGRGRGDSFLARSRLGDSDRGDRFAGDNNRYVDDRYEGGRFGDRDRFDSSRDNKYASRDRYVSDRYPPSGDRFGSSGYNNDSDRFPVNGYGKDRGYYRDGFPVNGYGKDRVYYRDGGPRGIDKYGSGGPARDEGRSYRNRPAPYDRPSRAGRPSSFDRY
ncbi:glycine-rich RNA-binding protein RZ1C-like isoform X2 [Momordica charantia]|nr:glycine-rich RNA-binding protein RZ1C-like isoform X2 [Momordica charantia]XP_022139345.1 glycine-rich RNA-binding protein RZ1C-like isoform X2 [Momordica charantia]